MEMKSVLFILLTFFGLALTEAQQKNHCQYMLYNCTQMVRPFLNDDRYMFPTSPRDIDDMCKMWSGFVDCVRHFMTDCSSEDQRSKFNNAVGDSMDTVHAICSSDKYQTEYLANAECFKRVSIGSCDSYYRRMVEQVSNQEAENNHICCAYSQFKNCVTEPLMEQCGNRAKTLLDHSMTFLMSMCGKTHYS
ncbi:uncharacterized protein LOC111083663 [Limulus polyphemus]|uniref:Uncharacterized protein LOC111083663 n=1 Tax=Limulus polyphemus TaxID=6850 RepID=A0ABM1RXB3_LIMPO|nr:uncharacterized protein LOC111083663 [Limulus polyphemus]